MWVADADTREVEHLSINAHERGGHCQSWALQKPWSRELPASNPLARLREPPLPGPRHWHPGRKVRQGAKSTHCGKASAEPMGHDGKCLPLNGERNPEALPREREYERARTGANPNLKSRRRHERASANATRHHKATQMRENVSPVGRRENCRTKLSCPLGRDVREAAEGARFDVSIQKSERCCNTALQRSSLVAVTP